LRYCRIILHADAHQLIYTSAHRHCIPIQTRIAQQPVTRSRISRLQSVILQRGIAFLLMVPAIYVEWNDFPSWRLFTDSSLTDMLIISIAVPSLAYLITRVDKSQVQQVLLEGLMQDRNQWIAYLVATCLYMIGYELLLRGILLHYLAARFEIIYAIGINALIYAAMHLVKDRREALLSLPLGIFLCWLTLYTKSIWPAACLHTVMALSFEYFYSRKKTHV
jgi:membrane protease YdiL (CAAX protease family)